MKKKQFLAAAALFVGAVSVSAETYEYPYLRLQLSDGSMVVLPCESLSFSFNDGNLVATATDGNHSIPLSQLSSMSFSTDDPTEVQSITAAAECSAAVEILSLTGTPLGRYASLAAARQSLSRGMYIVKTNDRTFKIVVK